MGSWVLRTDLRPGDLGWILRQHGLRYALDKGYDFDFEKDIATSIVSFIDHYFRSQSAIWIAEVDKQIVGTIAVVPINGYDAEIRWILVDPSFQGRGLGTELMSAALTFSRNHGFRAVQCRNVASDSPGIPLYEKCGFSMKEDKVVNLWGQVWHSRSYVLKF